MLEPGQGVLVVGQEEGEPVSRDLPGEDGEILLLQRLTKGLLRKRGVA